MLKQILNELSEAKSNYYRMLVTTCDGKQTKEKPFDFLDIVMNMNNKKICKLDIQYGKGKVEVGKTTTYERKDGVWYRTKTDGKNTNQKVKPKLGKQPSIDNI